MTARSRRTCSCSIGGPKVKRLLALATVSDWLHDRLGLSPAVQTHLLITVLVIAGLWLLERVVLAVVYRRFKDPWTRYRWRKSEIGRASCRERVRMRVVE